MFVLEILVRQDLASITQERWRLERNRVAAIDIESQSLLHFLSLELTPKAAQICICQSTVFPSRIFPSVHGSETRFLQNE